MIPERHRGIEEEIASQYKHVPQGSFRSVLGSQKKPVWNVTKPEANIRKTLLIIRSTKR